MLAYAILCRQLRLTTKKNQEPVMRDSINQSRCPSCAGLLHLRHDAERCAALMAARRVFTGLLVRAGVPRGVGKPGGWLTGKPLVD